MGDASCLFALYLKMTAMCVVFHNFREFYVLSLDLFLFGGGEGGIKSKK